MGEESERPGAALVRRWCGTRPLESRLRPRDTYKLIGYDLQSGDEKWFVEGMPTASCASPVTSDGDLYFAAWSPGAADDTGFKLPPFELVANRGRRTATAPCPRRNCQPSLFKGFFDTIDANKDGKITRAEWDGALALVAAAKNQRLRAQARRHWRRDSYTRPMAKVRRLPYVPSAIVYGGQFVMVKDGGIVTAYDATTGDELYQKRAVASGKYYASPVAANGHIYFASLADGTITVLKAGSNTPEVVAKNPPLGERLAATPAIADNTLYVRTAEHLYAFSEN